MTELPEGWRALSLSEVARGGLFGDGDWIESKDQDPEGSVRLTQLADVGVGEFRDRSSRWLREDQAADLHCTFLQPSDVLIARMPEPIGRACLVPDGIGRAVTAVDVAILRVVDREIEPRYVMWALNNPKFHAVVESLQSGTTRKRISRKNLATLAIPIPDPHEQRRIVDILEDHLSRLDAAAALSIAAVRRLDILQVSGIWRATHGLLGLEPLRLSDVAEVRLGRQRSPKNHTGDRMRPYLRAANVGWDELRLDDVKQMQFTESESETYELRDGDILLTEASGTASEVGKSAVYRGEGSGVCFQNTVLRVRCHEGVDPGFVQLYLLAEARLGKFVAESRGVGIHHLGRARLASWPMVIPAGDLQIEAVKRARGLIEATARAREGAQIATTRARGLRRSLLAAAFAGQLTGRTTDIEMVEEMAGV